MKCSFALSYWPHRQRITAVLFRFLSFRECDIKAATATNHLHSALLLASKSGSMTVIVIMTILSGKISQFTISEANKKLMTIIRVITDAT
ncbi:hypothetical protein BVRB_9g221030 [Beta vulgaris subsp. vulgaris]|nr:hypothetical protein BVRB_9g221030 [Beta vulgaris subsp. vulgaris]